MEASTFMDASMLAKNKAREAIQEIITSGNY